jgi:hypothetical protein
MSQVVWVELFQGPETCHAVALARAEFERALDALFAEDSGEVVVTTIADRQLGGVTDLRLDRSRLAEESGPLQPGLWEAEQEAEDLRLAA